MTSKSEGSGGPKKTAKKTTQKSTKSNQIIVANYEVGKGKPPMDGRIKPGERRNPRGRPQKPKVGERTLDYFFNEVVTVEKDGRRQSFTKRELAYAQLANRAAKGDDKAIRLMLANDLARKVRKGSRSVRVRPRTDRENPERHAR